jgi:hypothetical protein
VGTVLGQSRSIWLPGGDGSLTPKQTSNGGHTQAEYSRQVDVEKKSLIDEFAKIRSSPNSEWSKEVARLQSQNVDAYLTAVAKEQQTL